MSSHPWLYPIFHCRGYRVTKVQTDEQRLLLYIEPQPHKVCCPQCGSRDVIRRGQTVRWLRNLPVGAHRQKGDIPRLFGTAIVHRGMIGYGSGIRNGQAGDIACAECGGG